MARKIGSNIGWYHDSSTGSFGGIFYCDDRCGPISNESYSPIGPFKTFGKAKADAIAYFRVDIDQARNCIHQIKTFKKVTANAQTRHKSFGVYKTSPLSEKSDSE